jgi:Winged helix DNA-binding domain
MDVRQLHRLGKRLSELSGLAAGAPGDITLTPGEEAVLEQAIEHPGSSIREIHDRTGFAQTHVSGSVVRLKKRGLLATAAPAPVGPRASAWRSSTRVRTTDQACQTIGRIQSRPVDKTVVQAVGDPAKAKRAVTLMDELADILL